MNDVVRARIDRKTKTAAGAVLKRIGLTPSAAFRMMMNRIAEEKQLPFEPYRPNKVTRAALDELRAGKGKKFKTAAALMADLRADD